MAPEAFDGVRSVQTDVWSAGVICYQLVAGRLPFPQTDSTALLGAILRNNPTLLPQSVPGWLQKVIARALEKNPARRYQSASEMREAMRKVNRSPKPDDGGLAPVSDEIETIVRPPKRPKSSPPETGNRFLKSAAGIIVSLVTIIAGIIGVIQYRQSRPGYDLTGEWKITNTIEATSYNPYQGLRLGYRVFLQQRGHDISGSGEKWWENEKEIPFRYHSPITVTGTIKDDKISLTVVEQGSRRQTTGTFTWVATTKDDRSWKMTRKADHLTGTFTSTAANSSGSSVGERIN
jgi:serine/threonine protein kinase